MIIKNTHITACLILSLGFITHAAEAVSETLQETIPGSFKQTEQINEVITFSDNSSGQTVRIFNVYGAIDVAGHASDEVIIEATNQVHAKTQVAVNEGLDEIGLAFTEHQGTLYIYLDSPFTHFDPVSGELWHSDTCWRRDDCSRKHPKKAYKYRMDIMVSVPDTVNLEVSAINDGDITITGVEAESLKVSNINGAIDMVDVAGKTYVNAINQDINLVYSKNPDKDSEFESINGDLNITFAGQPNAEVVYETMHGDLYTRFDVKALEPQVLLTSQQKEHGIKYQLGAASRLQLGSGGPVYQFKTLNGDIKIK